MPWLRNPFSRRSDPDPEASDAEAPPDSTVSPPSPQPPTSPEPASSPDPPRPSQDIGAILAHFKTPTSSLSGHQIFYIFIIDGLGAAILSGGINFAIAYAMYTTQDTNLHPIRLFHLPNTLAGDAAVTIIIQSLITWLIETALVARDLRTGGVSPIGFLPRPTAPFLKRLFFLDEFAAGASPRGGGGGSWLRFLVENGLRAMATAVVGFVVLWPVSVGVLTACGRREGGDWVFEKTWTPQVFKLVLGGVWALVQTPVYAGFWLVREGWVLRGGDEEGEGVVGGGGGEGEGGGSPVESGSPVVSDEEG
ncbi:hypothetical protein CONLIGDRAFT_718362 [Coniochaeta ligniaria NRRL 30616]|uniref:Uncharacterized protein n=1 Tax=Coniochaeta ligniaria NRRL 30616 TaxID=1408157 RepID=A0A1J7IAR3_9PEZI|nr:hypothetical protein CONLIGDRAFT_718362 [Coniochaeta ligniaria NRRL 30616]